MQASVQFPPVGQSLEKLNPRTKSPFVNNKATIEHTHNDAKLNTKTKRQLNSKCVSYYQKM